MFSQSLYPKTKQVLELLSSVRIVKDFYLAGGTALALQLGHRKSVDLDFFIQIFPDMNKLKSSFSHLNIKILNENLNSLDLEIDEVKVSFLEYKYPLITSLTEYQDIKLASIDDIACMKLTAISSRGSKKDFVDLYFILKNHINIADLLDNFKKKYIGIEYSDKHIIRTLSYFQDSENDPDVDFIDQKISWSEIKASLIKETKRYL